VIFASALKYPVQNSLALIGLMKKLGIITVQESSTYVKILFTNLEEFHKKLNELQQLEDELENNVRKWHWAGHVQRQ